MLVLRKISKFDLRKYVEISYRGDNDLLDYYWGDGFSLQEAVKPQKKRKSDRVLGKNKRSYGRRFYLYALSTKC